MGMHARNARSMHVQMDQKALNKLLKKARPAKPQKNALS